MKGVHSLGHAVGGGCGHQKKILFDGSSGQTPQNSEMPHRLQYRAPRPAPPRPSTAAAKCSKHRPRFESPHSRHNCESAAEAPFTRLNLCRNDIARNRHGILLRHPILRPTQQHIAALPPLKQPQETSIFGKKRQIHIIFAAKPPAKTVTPAHSQNRKYAR